MLPRVGMLVGSARAVSRASCNGPFRRRCTVQRSVLLFGAEHVRRGGSRSKNGCKSSGGPSLSMVSKGIPRFEYGRHETFPVRYGWLGKGLWCLRTDGYYRADTEVADRLGLGSNMAKSLQFWLEATGIADADNGTTSAALGGSRRRKIWRISEFGTVLGHLDPHFEYPATWWFLHMALARRAQSVWGWFFNDFHERHFDRATCVNAFREHAHRSAPNPPSIKMAQRDVACVLQAYGATRGSVSDPEDATACPLRELGLVTVHRDSERLEKTRPIDAIPVEVFLACASNVAGGNRVQLSSLMGQRNGPARVFGLSSGQIEELAETASGIYRPDVRIDLLGSERTLVLPDHRPEWWLKRHFDRIRTAAVAA